MLGVQHVLEEARNTVSTEMIWWKTAFLPTPNILEGVSQPENAWPNNIPEQIYHKHFLSYCFYQTKVKVHDCSPSLHNADVTPTDLCLPINKGCCLKWWHGDCCFHYINVCVIVCVDYVAAFFVASVPPLLKWEPVCLDHLKKSLFSIKCCYIWYVYLICDPSLATLVFVILCVWFTCSISIIDNGGFSIVIKICERRVSISNGSICDSLCPLLTI